MVDAETIANIGMTFSVDKIKNFDVREDDIFIITYPKSGTTWMKQIVSMIQSKGDIDAIKDIPLDVRAPYLEFCLSTDDNEVRELQRAFSVPDDFDVNELTSPRVLVCHFREELLPRQIEEKKPKIIYVARNPKDIMVSCYIFSELIIKALFQSTSFHNFGEYMKEFLTATGQVQVIVGDGSTWPEHVLPWWEKRGDENVLFMKYEDMIKDLRTCIQKVSKFLSVELTPEMVENIRYHCSFEGMKKNDITLKGSYCRDRIKVNAQEQSPFVRKGGTGGWKQHFTVSDNEEFDATYSEWMRDTDLEMTFEL